jgi:hypothetical protein
MIPVGRVLACLVARAASRPLQGHPGVAHPLSESAMLTPVAHFASGVASVAPDTPQGFLAPHLPKQGFTTVTNTYILSTVDLLAGGICQ